MNLPRTFWSALTLAAICATFSGSLHAVAAADNLVISRSTMNFGNVVMGSTTHVVEMISNPTASDIVIGAGSVDTNAFQLSNTTFPLSVRAGQQIAVDVVFSPAAPGNVSGSLILSLNGNVPYMTIPLYGNGVIQGQLAASPSSIAFAAGNKAQQVTETITNTGGTTVVLRSAIPQGGGFTISGLTLPAILHPSETAVFTVSLSSAATANISGNITLNGWIRWYAPGQRGDYRYATRSSAATSLSIPVSHTATVLGQLSPAPASVSFGSVRVGNTQTSPATLTNSGAGPVTITQATASGSGFTVSGLPLPMTLTPGESATFSAAYAPQAAGSAQGQITVLSDASNATVNIGLSGSANTPGQLSISPASLNFGAVGVGKSQQLSATLAASGSSVTVSSASANSSEFSLSGIQFPITISAGQSVSFAITFAPQTSGTASANIAFGSSASTAVESLSGSGTPPAQHNVTLAWSAGGANVAGYNVYRGTTAGGPYAKLNSATSPATTFGDANVSSGQTYFYVTTAVDPAGSESAHSNEVQAAIP